MSSRDNNFAASIVDLVKGVIRGICANSLACFSFSPLQPVRTSLCLSTCTYDWLPKTFSTNYNLSIFVLI